MKTTLLRSKFRAVIPAALSFAAASNYSTQGANISTANQSILASAYYADPGSSAASVAVSDSDAATFFYEESPTEWTRKMQKRFNDLSKKEALTEILPNELSELNRLSETRRRLLFPRSSEEILREIQDRQVTNQLQSALNAYVKFHSKDN